MSNIASEIAPDWAMREAKVLLPCRCSIYATYHARTCGGNYRAAVADALREADQRGYRRGVEEAAKIVNGWHIKKGGYGVLVEAIHDALLPAETEEQK